MAKKYLELFNPLLWPIWAAMGLLWLITRLPQRLQMTIGKNLGKLAYCFPTQLKHITHTNIKLCFPNYSAKEQAQLSKKNFESLGVGLIESAMGWWLPDDQLQNLFQIDGIEYLQQALAKGKGVILVGPHFTGLEMVGRLFSGKFAIAVLYRPHKSRILAFIQKRFREKHYTRYIPRHRLREFIRALNNNTAVWYAYDIDGGKKNSVFAPFFGVQTASLTLPSRLIRLSDAVIVPVGYSRDDNAFRYHVTLYPPLENFPGHDLIEDATRLNAALEYSIRQKPEQYIWQYKRFKTRPLGEARYY